jgi:hypothetical protein
MQTGSCEAVLFDIGCVICCGIAGYVTCSVEDTEGVAPGHRQTNVHLFRCETYF